MKNGVAAGKQDISLMKNITKDAMFRLAVAYQGSQDNPNAIRLFEEYVAKFPDDKMVAEAYLSLGDLAISDVKPDEQPTFAQIESAQKNYNFVREKSQEMRLITDATFNEGEVFLKELLITPEGVVDHYLSLSKIRMRCSLLNITPSV